MEIILIWIFLSFVVASIGANRKIGYLGTGISGGEEGALNGPSIMPGGSEWAWDLMKSCLQKISAQIDGYPCCYYIGSDGAGHFVKMVHNGIEYAMMELIGETYALLQRLHNLNAKEIGDIYTKWNQGELNSYLLEITSKIFKVIDAKTQKPLVDIILDKAEHKGTGKWTSLTSLNLSEAIPTITQAVYQRFLSANKQIRIKASNILPKPSIDDEIKTDIQKWLNIETIRKALYLSIICCYAQGFSLIYSAGKEYSWKFNMKEIAKLWKGGCIIRAKLLKNIEEAFIKNPELENLLLSQSLTEFFSNYQDSWRETISCAVKIGVSIPAFTSSLSYYDGLRSENLPLNLIQAQRDFFGAHTFERIDDTGGKKFHYNWNEHDYEK